MAHRLLWAYRTTQGARMIVRTSHPLNNDNNKVVDKICLDECPRYKLTEIANILNTGEINTNLYITIRKPQASSKDLRHSIWYHLLNNSAFISYHEEA